MYVMPMVCKYVGRLSRPEPFRLIAGKGRPRTESKQTISRVLFRAGLAAGSVLADMVRAS